MNDSQESLTPRLATQPPPISGSTTATESPSSTPTPQATRISSSPADPDRSATPRMSLRRHFSPVDSSHFRTFTPSHLATDPSPSAESRAIRAAPNSSFHNPTSASDSAVLSPSALSIPPSSPPAHAAPPLPHPPPASCASTPNFSSRVSAVRVSPRFSASATLLVARSVIITSRVRALSQVSFPKVQRHPERMPRGQPQIDRLPRNIRPRRRRRDRPSTHQDLKRDRLPDIQPLHHPIQLVFLPNLAL